MKNFVPFEIAKKLKEKGFREKCFATYTPYGRIFKFNEIDTDKRPASYKLNIEEFRECYNYYKDNNIDAPTISQVLKWLREKDIIITITYTRCLMHKTSSQMMFGLNVQNIQGDLLAENTEVAYGSYEQAVLDSIECALNHLI